MCGRGGCREHEQEEMVFACVSSGKGKVRDVRDVLRVWLPWLWPWAGCQRWGLALGLGAAGSNDQAKDSPEFSPWSHRHHITMSPGREVEEEAQMCVCLTSVHSKTSGHLFVFVCVRVCTPVLVCALLAVCLCLSLSLYVSGPLSRCM